MAYSPYRTTAAAGIVTVAHPHYTYSPSGTTAAAGIVTYASPCIIELGPFSLPSFGASATADVLLLQ